MKYDTFSNSIPMLFIELILPKAYYKDNTIMKLSDAYAFGRKDFSGKNKSQCL